MTDRESVRLAREERQAIRDVREFFTHQERNIPGVSRGSKPIEISGITCVVAVDPLNGSVTVYFWQEIMRFTWNDTDKKWVQRPLE